MATELGLALAQQGHEIHFITYKQPVRLEALSENLHFHEVNVPDYPLFQFQPYELALSSKLVDMVKLHKIEVLHVHYAIPHAYAAYMAKKMLQDQGINLPIVTTLHGTDITGGNSGSPVMNANGDLIGLAFDGNWEAMSGDIAFEPELQRTISVDIRYVLWIVDKFAGATNIIEELDLIYETPEVDVPTEELVD